ncbi:uncharacterized mitochondrial protein AtMg00860-like [Cryptomeria japonica]|uniref:uncharacterized mitochondrial protein AtMg00860-like n=1 Tax=Cryptomeria japonica TaxID=3369 RepID=UPI0027D9EFAC|nr:uncharacterized mitochondrial protein AtMg00860-like [Cryptomeria japonica]
MEPPANIDVHVTSVEQPAIEQLKEPQSPLIIQAIQKEPIEIVVTQSSKKEMEKNTEKAIIKHCREHEISLNPKKSVFCVTEGKLLGHIVSKEGVKIDPKRVNAIQPLNLPSSRTGVRSFFGQVNLLRRFVPEFAETTKHIVGLLSEQHPFKWPEEAKNAFEKIKGSVANVPTLVNPDFTKDFILYCYASDHTMSGILLQLDEHGAEMPIAFMSTPLKKHELKYSPMEKHAYTVVKAMKQF